jgi:hypothetical protein
VIFYNDGKLHRSKAGKKPPAKVNQLAVRPLDDHRANALG